MKTLKPTPFTHPAPIRVVAWIRVNGALRALTTTGGNPSKATIEAVRRAMGAG